MRDPTASRSISFDSRPRCLPMLFARRAQRMFNEALSLIDGL
jgi:hypothetical protein